MAHTPPAADSPSIFDPRHSLRVRALVLAVGGAIVFTLLLGGIARSMLHRQLERQLGASFENLAFQVGDKLDRGVAERLRGLQFAASLAPFHSATTPAAERRAVLESLLDASTDFAWLGFTDATGTVVSATQGLFERDDVSDLGWFRGAREQAFAGDVRELPGLTRARPDPAETHPRFLALAVPVRDTREKFLGVLAAQLPWTWTRGVQFSVVPEAARREHLGVTIYAATGEVLADSGASGWTEPPPAPPGAASQRARGFLQENVPGGGEYLTGYARSRVSRNFRGLGWLVVVRQPVREAFAPGADLQRWITRAGFALAALIAIVTWLVASRLTRRLTAIGVAANRIRAGDVLTLMPRPPGHDEMARMCGALGHMVDGLREQQAKLEADHARLTARLHPPTDAERDQARQRPF